MIRVAFDLFLFGKTRKSGGGVFYINLRGKDMESHLSNTIIKRKTDLTEQLKSKLESIAVNCPFYHDDIQSLDDYLIQARITIPNCKLLYAVSCDGIQLSSNILSNGKTNLDAQGQNLSNRPYMLNKSSEDVFSLSPVYLSKTDRKPSITAMHHIFDASGELAGCIAADFDIDAFPSNEIALSETQSWRQIKGDPAIRKNLFQQERINSAMDNSLDQVNDIITNLICERGIFHAKLHYSSSRATLWPYERPYEYQLHVLDEIIDADVCLVYPPRDFPKEAKVNKHQVQQVFERLKDLRNADETIYLRSGSLNIINKMVGLNFSCDGSHYMEVDEFLAKPDSFWFGI